MMNFTAFASRKLILCVLSLIILSGVSIYADEEATKHKLYPHIDFGETTPPPRPAKVVQRVAFPETPKTFPVLRVKKLTIEEQKTLLIDIFKVLPLEESYTREQLDFKFMRIGRVDWSKLPEGEPVEAQIGDWQVSVWPGGQFSIYNNPHLPAKFDAVPPTEEDALKLANEIFPKIALLLQEPATYAAVQPNHWRDSKIAGYGVFYRAEKNGLSFGGLTISVEAGLRIYAISSSILRSVQDSFAPILSPEEALQMLKEGEGRAGSEISGATAYVDSIKLVYYIPPHAIDMSYIPPLYVFAGKVSGENNKTGTWGGRIEAIRPEYLEKRGRDK